MRDVNEHIIIPCCRKHGVSSAQHLNKDGLFVTHCWMNPLLILWLPFNRPLASHRKNQICGFVHLLSCKETNIGFKSNSVVSALQKLPLSKLCPTQKHLWLYATLMPTRMVGYGLSVNCYMPKSLAWRRAIQSSRDPIFFLICGPSVYKQWHRTKRIRIEFWTCSYRNIMWLNRCLDLAISNAWYSACSFLQRSVADHSCHADHDHAPFHSLCNPRKLWWLETTHYTHTLPIPDPKRTEGVHGASSNAWHNTPPVLDESDLDVIKQFCWKSFYRNGATG